MKCRFRKALTEPAEKTAKPPAEKRFSSLFSDLEIFCAECVLALLLFYGRLIYNMNEKGW
ncbi:hypothetical protein ACH95_15750 [Bacillus glycinifermentans]|uniref:Uncharacterized protein n=1 Tax=Bacillus glycinifermentans TaxID=1664069 RepID=A0A0J6EYW0_9BACI|nr:hypothetical protein COP00_20705 [Bacillus glycinifermentans]KMM57238.1 hypothetical protein ACH95_15750 [Bacillus glycinifermentans]KRT93553.1 hypothetical protein AB447_217255 [Bacillus glycinifermentans]